MSIEEVDPRVSDRQIVFAEQVRLVYQLGIVGALAVIAVACLYTLALWTVAPQRELLGWFLAMSLVSLARIALAGVRKRHAVESRTREWAWVLIALATFTGMLWAYAGTALFPFGHPQMQLIAAIMLVGMPAGAVASFGPYAASYVCYLVFSIVPFAIGLFLRGGETAGWLLFASAVYIAYLIRVALWTEKTLRDNIIQRLELQRMALGLAQARDAAESADRAKSNFLANMSRQVRAPLNAMRDMNDHLLMMPMHTKLRERLQTAQQASLALLDTIDAALDMSRIQAGQLDVHEEQFDPHVVAARLHRMCQPSAQRKNLEFSVAIAPEVPHELLGDPVRWRQVLGILVDNALKFTERGSVSVTIEARVQGGVCALRTEVQDTGIGLAPEERSHLFQRLTQIQGSDAAPHAGAGLGIAADLAKLMGGDIGVTSEKGAGSRFWFNARLRTAAP
jgi:signal transduction histidine kinase